MCIWSGTPGGQGPPNSEGGTVAWSSNAAFAPGRVCASFCAGIDHLVGQALGGSFTALDDGAEADLLGIADAVVELGERLAVVEVRGVNHVPGSAQLSGEGEAPLRQALRMMKDQELSHVHGAE